jgi:hypothetical protein
MQQLPFFNYVIITSNGYLMNLIRFKMNGLNLRHKKRKHIRDYTGTGHSPIMKSVRLALRSRPSFFRIR